MKVMVTEIKTKILTDLQKCGSWKIQLTIVITVISSKDIDEE